MNQNYYWRMESPIGPLVLAGSEGVLRHIRFHGHGEREWLEDRAPFERVVEQLRAYFAGELTEFDVPMEAAGTPFQKRVWRELLTIPYGKTATYGEIAARIGMETAVRAVGAANGANPIPILVPCHRVIGSNGKLTGFGGGIETKEKLLRLESRQLRLL